MSTTSPEAKSRDRPDAIPRGSKRPRTDAEGSDKGLSGRNRHRVTRACNECRRRKDRCGGQRPSCKSCVENNRTCSYGPSKKRGLRPGYVRGIETLLGLIFKSIDGSEAWICGLLEGDTHARSFCPVSDLHESNISVDLLLETWHKSSVSKKMGSLLNAEGEFDEDGTETSQYFDTKVIEGLALLTSASNTAGAPMTPMDTNTTQPDIPSFDLSPLPLAAPSPAERPMQAQSQTSMHSPSKPISNHSLNSPLPIPDLPKNWSYLLDLYFETTHCWFPISQKHELLRAAYTLSNGPSTTASSSLSSGELGFLHAVLAYASYQSTTLLNTSRDARDKTSSLRSPQDLINTSLFADASHYSLGHVRALLIICLFEMDQKNWSLAWTAIGRAVYTAISIGLISQSTATDPSTRDGIKRTIMGCATLETMVAARLNTLPCLTSPNTSLLGGLLTDGNEEWEPWQPKILTEREQRNSSSHVPGHIISTFNKSLKAITLLNDLIHYQKNPATAENLNKIIHSCQENLSTLDDLKTATDLTPHALCLWIASVTVSETVAAESFASSGCILERPEGYWAKIVWLASLAEKRAHSIGHCAIPAVTKACIELLMKSLHVQHPQYVGTNVEQDLSNARDAIARCLAALQNPPGDEPQVDSLDDSQRISSGKLDHHPLTIQPALGKDSIPYQLNLPPTPSTMLSNKVDSSISQNQALPISSRTPGGISFPVDPALVPNIEDDGLFDSLATLDSTDWLANPPEFMQHLGMLEDAPSNLEHLFDMGF
ncbi:quinic acid utilization activator [Fusarium beomiforme]|uniref:Quinic acid utilization activator n=1 Tax=Fusarium beomiforme TaxID=44412 RepID=A0A9P5A8X1_9HYPO|nr:quinic acid utilization activator [Fusarium beomiforme]